MTHPYEQFREALLAAGAVRCVACQSYVLPSHNQEHDPHDPLFAVWSVPTTAVTTPAPAPRAAMPSYQTRLVCEPVPAAEAEGITP
jgi:hypothetical protein